MIQVEDIRGRATISIAETAELLQIGINQTYAAAASGEIPTLRLGRTYRVPVPALLAMLGDAPAVEAPDGTRSSPSPRELPPAA